MLERAHHVQLDGGDTLRAARTAGWIGMQLMVLGEAGRGTGWIARATRLVERHPDDCVERGYLLIPLAYQHEATGDPAAAAAVAGDAVAIAERFGDQDLFALSLHMQGHFLVRSGRVTEGLGLLDEAMVAVTTGALSPIVSGLVYCGVIMGCQAAYEPRRAHEWTAALARWCERQPDMVAFSGRCHVHRAEIMQLDGAWSDALEEARCAARRAAQGNHRSALAEAAYVQGEVHRLRGELGQAEAAYREASRHGREPHPGLALMRLAQGDVEAAVAAIRRVLGETAAPADRLRLLPACTEIMLAAGDIAAARRACDELATSRPATMSACSGRSSPRPAARSIWWLATPARHCSRCAGRGGSGRRSARPTKRRACARRSARHAWCLVTPRRPRSSSRRRVTRSSSWARHRTSRGLTGGSRELHGLTARELQVLRLVADGRTNKAIAAELVLSERTVDRHVSNIFAKLAVSSRAAATARAYEQRLV